MLSNFGMNKKKKTKNSIFISIAAYRDSEIIPTVLDCIKKADKKSRLFFGICLQDTKKKYWQLKNLKKRHKLNMQIIYVDWKDSQGACWARYIIQKKLYRNQDYYLQIDSHHRFIEQWDSVLVHLLNKKKAAGHNKAIIGGYCPAFDNENNQCNLDGVQMCAFDTFANDGDLMFKPLVLSSSLQSITDIPARYLSAHFLFSDGSFCIECPYDPNLYFRGEELSLSARAYTHGYEFFHPTFPIIWHLYLRLKNPKHWDNHVKQNGFIIDSSTKDNKSKERIRKLLNMEKNDIKFGQYGLGTIKSLHDYELYAGLDFKNKKVHKYTANIRNDAPLAFKMSENEWSKNMLNKKLIVIKFPESIIQHINIYLLNMTIQIYSHKNILLHESNISSKQLASIMKNNFDFKKEIGIEDIPTRAVLIPRYKDPKLGKTIKITNILYYDI